MRRAARVDDNQKPIVEAFRALGCSVLHLHSLGQGAGDILVGYGGLCMMCEIKDGSKPPSRRRLTALEDKFHATWTGGIRIVESVDDVTECVNTLREWHKAIWSATAIESKALKYKGVPIIFDAPANAEQTKYWQAEYQKKLLAKK